MTKTKKPVSEKADSTERVLNRFTTLSLRLLVLVSEELDPTEFTLRQIRESLNARPDARASEFEKIYRFGPSHLVILKEMGLIDYDEDSHAYYITAAGEIYLERRAEVDEED